MSALVLAGCGADTTPLGLAQHLEQQGVPLDGISAQRYYDTVKGTCGGDYAPSVLTGMARPENATALRRMVTGMEYVCPDEADDFALMVEAVGD